MNNIKKLASTFIFLLLPQLAFAHYGHGVAKDFSTGFLHPLSGVDHLLSMIAVGMIALQYKNKSLWFFPVVFITFMIIGGMISTYITPLGFIESSIALSVVILGVLLMKNEKISFRLQLVLTACFALFHGYVHVVNLLVSNNVFLYSLGIVLSTGCLHLSGIYIAKTFRLEKITGLIMLIVGSILIFT